MKKSLPPILLAATLLCGCAHQYVMKLSNGVEVTTNSKPKLKGVHYCYKDAQGRDVYVPQSRVLQIEPASMAAEEKKFEAPKVKKPKHWWQFWRSS
jgi:hypothetical protein